MLTLVFDAEVINDEVESDGACFMAPEAGCMLDGVIDRVPGC